MICKKEFIQICINAALSACHRHSGIKWSVIIMKSIAVISKFSELDFIFWIVSQATGEEGAILPTKLANDFHTSTSADNAHTNSYLIWRQKWCTLHKWWFYGEIARCSLYDELYSTYDTLISDGSSIIFHAITFKNVHWIIFFHH